MKQRATVICRRDDQILYVRKSKARWNLPGGKVEADESPAQAAARELREETGLILEDLAYISRFEGGTVLHHVFEVSVTMIATPAPQNEIADCKWFTRKELGDQKVSPAAKSIVKAFLTQAIY
ncbi:NUDIX hydrolase [Pseudomonas petrae]|uniref:NUDIX domain-containing protein n=1 Tax=Pseudomonas petrae TaxID=2912190 RepID=A0ABS9ICX7_9PSED|nr:NUDIX hydrolase [Pseudomonas petrae]MCF7532872.1 NUDIX domain-containing protein [Pseudomonas petrae]MCF7535771.1 NUDIX domain-containing protein [Pseudomonas petrae]MCF7545116.1 NUDIX domain-containing protein [Pseudomonas petrae]MCF7554834.1 NUDIX domain-containing protein [Pseudomonas petrae]